MFQNLDFSALFGLATAILDYAVKAVVHFKDTDEGRDEWLDIEAAARQVMGDDDGAENARAQASNIRQSVPSQRTTANVSNDVPALVKSSRQG